MRNFVFAAIPSGCIGLVLFLAFPLSTIDAVWAEYAILSAVPLTMIAFAMSIIFMITPPQALKPEWLIAAEMGRGGKSTDE